MEDTSPGLELEKAVKELYHWRYNKGEGTNFHSMLFNLFQKADPYNKKKLTAGFLEESLALTMWYCAGNNGDDLFRKFGLME